MIYYGTGYTCWMVPFEQLEDGPVELVIGANLIQVRLWASEDEPFIWIENETTGKSTPNIVVPDEGYAGFAFTVEDGLEFAAEWFFIYPHEMRRPTYNGAASV